MSGTNLKPSNNDYDWLGSGIYFWEANPQRGLDYAVELSKLSRGAQKVKKPAVVGAIISMGLCLDLTTTSGINAIKETYAFLEDLFRLSKELMPKNHPDGLRRKLDCAVVNLLHEVRSGAKEPPIDTVRGLFVEGRPIYEGSGFFEKTHSQICVRNPDCIKGMFRVRL